MAEAQIVRTNRAPILLVDIAYAWLDPYIVHALFEGPATAFKNVE